MKVMPNDALGHWIWWGMGGVIALVIFSALVVRPFGATEPLGLFAKHSEPSGEFKPFAAPGAGAVKMPLLEVDEKGYLRNYLEQQHALLSSYGYVDKAKNEVHIPVERAMRLVLEEKLPTRGSR